MPLEPIDVGEAGGAGGRGGGEGGGGGPPARGMGGGRAGVWPPEPIDVGGAGEPAVVEGVKGEWRVAPAALGRDFEGRTALLSPFGRLVYDRARALELFDFEYTLEM